MLLFCIAIPEANALLNDESAWTWYLTTSEIAKAILCSFIPVRWLKLTGAGFFSSQALDEIVGGNLFQQGLWEYLLLAAYALAVYHLTKNEQGR